MNNKNRRTVFFVSDRTGLTAESLGRSLISQFDGIEFKQVMLPYIDSADKARAASVRVDAAAQGDGKRPLVFSTIIQPEFRNIMSECDGLFLDLFDVFIAPLQAELGVEPSHEAGLSHGVGAGYSGRMNAVNYALNHDDGGITRDLPSADVVLIGVSRCGKTPTSLYLALQFGIHAANYPLVEEDFAAKDLPSPLKPLLNKLYGLTIAPERLHQIRAERSPDSRYASLENCRSEVRQAENLMSIFNIPRLDITSMSVEEIATTIVHQAGLR
jgi:[pyruvate, water dikinase]-phosphate phosphotransferase / [pyruvate, water dikinase] kinase